MINEKVLSPNPSKIEAVINFLRPKNIKNIRQILGFAGYYRRFIQNFAKRAKPLSKLLQNDEPFNWQEEQESAFQDLKNALCTAQLLHFSDMTTPFIIKTDASGFAIEGILSQGKIGSDMPIAYTSRVLRLTS